ncbi:NAD(P)-dependent dehydrogenase (short-subunit alcohol dehydrogenase family) [Sphingomonas sp. SORGH_AS 950]|uniref:SDR family NAD(P)-dependent oxidoreductase n=1 Tax=Sphingomonas sp. SORGH_AS_0950 TaxID=3041792 RepID=UPI00277F5446|nr:SDR family NAD(P)-dependent oxidoreductase [Sphingomonas sp. SORGH_AS_0950]MDQ1159537.1 NAD(P)-dependent dehydrogenase (short-subunit alcohol dehydrogenase family) [Sphingomonas sp. SORGH_AS_0950]
MAFLVANAGTAEATEFGDLTETDFDRMFDLNVRGVFFSVQALLPRIADGASIILIGSICSIGSDASGSVLAEVVDDHVLNRVRCYAGEATSTSDSEDRDHRVA